jgi:pimeloyl-ACP methyl ester carboxylesterase
LDTAACVPSPASLFDGSSHGPQDPEHPLALLQPLLDSGALPLDGKVPDVPVVVLTSTRQADKPVFFVATAQALAAKRELHASFVRRFRHGAQVLTSKSGHDIQLEEPELVVAAVNEAIAAADKDLAQARDERGAGPAGIRYGDSTTSVTR